jgi:predicted N-formylglutamate amidohydrolase
MQSLPPAVEVVNPGGTSRVVLTCEHASNFIPHSYGRLGLPESELTRHIAWDIGAAQVARDLASMIDAPLFLSGYSRLLIDCNRPLGSPTSIRVISESTVIPGNEGLSPEEAAQRAQLFYWPFQAAVSAHLDQRQSASRHAIVLGIHSFTPVFKSFIRPWHAGILFRQSTRFGHALVEALQAPGFSVTANEPYTIDDEGDYTVPVHGERRGLDAALVEIRQDLIADQAGAAQWALRLADALSKIA